MGENLLMVLGIVMLVGIVVGILAYKPMNYKMIREKGYDADQGIPRLLALGAVIIPVILSINVVQDVKILGIVFAGFYAACVALRVSKIGIVNALLISFLQALSAIWLVVKFIVQFSSRIFGRSEKIAIDQGEKAGREAARKAELRREYEQTVAQIERGSTVLDEVTGVTDALLDEAKEDYDEAVSKVGRE